MNAGFSGVSRDTVQGVPVWIRGALWIAWHGWTCPQLPFAVRTKQSTTCMQVFVRMLENVHGGQPTVVLRVSAL